jgi:hypothetical protein
LRVESSKSQAPRSREAPNPKLQDPEKLQISKAFSPQREREKFIGVFQESTGEVACPLRL